MYLPSFKKESWGWRWNTTQPTAAALARALERQGERVRMPCGLPHYSDTKQNG